MLQNIRESLRNGWIEIVVMELTIRNGATSSTKPGHICCSFWGNAPSLPPAVTFVIGYVVFKTSSLVRLIMHGIFHLQSA